MNNVSVKAPETDSHNGLLIRGNEYMKRHPDFKLMGRDEEIIDLQTILMRKDANGVLLTGPRGVGMTALCMGLQASKTDLKTPLDIVNIRFFWLDTDKLFESGDVAQIQKAFDGVRNTLKEDPQTVLIIENAGNFVDAARNTGTSSLINALLGDIKRANYQCILESPYEDIGKVLKCDSDMTAEFTLMEVKEPKAEALRAILKAAAPAYEAHHGIKISPEAIETVAMLSEKYRTKELQAQPTGALTLIDRALAAYRLKAHSEPFHVVALKQQFDAVNENIKGGKTPELESRHAALKSQLAEAERDWSALQTEFRAAYDVKRAAEEGIAKLEKRIDTTNAGDKAAIDKVKPKSADPMDDFAGFDEVETPEVIRMRGLVEQHRREATTSADRFKALEQRVNKDLLLTPEHVLATFSRISGIPVNKLTQDARDKLLNLDKVLSSRVYGQDHAVEAIADAVRVAKMGLQDLNKPQAAFMLPGPSGVGKTEIVKALTTALFDDETALIRLDMSEFMEKHSVSRLIGAPPGYAGFEDGGLLTNEMERNPNRVILVDEIEKAHPDVFNIFLQILDDARVTSGKGITSRFENTIIVMTTNLGAEFLLDPSLTYDDAKLKVMDALSGHFRNEFLNRFQGKENIVPFKRLDLDVLNRIAVREMSKLNDWVRPKGLSVELSSADIAGICEDRYDPRNGARAIPGYFTKAVRSKVARVMLEQPDLRGALTMHYNAASRDIVLTPPIVQSIAVPNDNDPQAAMTRAATLK